MAYLAVFQSNPQIWNSILHQIREIYNESVDDIAFHSSLTLISEFLEIFTIYNNHNFNIA